MDKEAKLIHRTNQLTKQNIYCIISSACKNNFMESDRKKYCQIFFLNKLILTNFRIQISKPSLPHQLFFELPPGRTYLIRSAMNNSSHDHWFLSYFFHIITIAQRNCMIRSALCTCEPGLCRRYYIFQFIKLPIYDFFGLINYVLCNYCFGISLVLISYDGGDNDLAFQLKWLFSSYAFLRP